MKRYCYLPPLILLLSLVSLALPRARAQVAENILMVTYDGLRWQEVFAGADARLLESKDTHNAEHIRATFWDESATERRKILLPFFWNTIAREGQILGHKPSGSAAVVTNGKNFSYPGYNELLTGAPDGRIISNRKVYNRNVTVLEWLNGQIGFEGRVAAFASWDVFPYIINTERSTVPVNAGWMPLSESRDPERLAVFNRIADEIPHYWAAVRFDAFTHRGALEYISKHKPRVLYVAYGETDDWAHDGRYDLYLESARRTDNYIEELWTLIQSMPQYAGKTALLLSTDHGRGDTLEDWTSHAADIEGCERIWYAMMGPGIPAKGIVRDRETTQSQYAATAAALLGLEFSAEGRQAAPPIRP